MFRSYMHLERYGNEEVVGIELGELTIFPKLDGTNSSVWLEPNASGEGNLFAGSRTRQLSIEADNAGFLAYVSAPGTPIEGKLRSFFRDNPTLRLYGEWLVPHTLKTYRDDAWRRFWIFDVFNDVTNQYLSYSEYKGLLDGCGLDYIPPLATIKNGDYEYFMHVLKQNVFFIKDGEGIGEGIVLKNYQFYNKFGNQVWAKIINNEFKEQHHREMGEPSSSRKILEEEIALKYVTESLCTKVYAKIVNEEGGWTSKNIPRLLGTVYHDLITEEMWNILKENGKGTTINFGMLNAFVIKQIKHQLPHLF